MALPGRDIPVVSSLDALDELVRWRPGMYLRQGVAPGSSADPRIDDVTGIRLPGVPVARIDPEPWWPGPAIDWIARRVIMNATSSDQPDRRPWLLYGHFVGYGPHHEPLVTDIEPVAWIDHDVVDQARQHFTARYPSAGREHGHGDDLGRPSAEARVYPPSRRVTAT
ncbi:hypothetical protein CLV30_104359 [Haloactinopolyspora alba]|uniref:Uncharacterized protein n=1 Tax=Haloactinopolyspora alba TaxID=648780 RepID=A0A2P8E7T2_9ACTN|nr:DUF6098 family protein [Haloactinopolyspora alba]PSL05487.1 hypothetical protein CLV30_104359 [Haloactinopolyspora alba]